MGQMVSYPTPGGRSVSGYLADVPGSAKSVVVIQEWWGLNDQIKGVADRFAAAGYRALAPDLYAGRVTEDPDEANHMMGGLDWVGATEQDLGGAVRYLKQGGGKCAVMGFCMGGALTILAAVKVPDTDAGVCFYGIPPEEAAAPKDIRVPLQCHFATQDDWCTPAAVDAFEAACKAGGVSLELYRYDAAHGFFNETRAEVHHGRSAAQSWERTLTFLGAKL
jgi:carboxymethylenebutenolidase